jgi:flagellar hook capping protein FlgD
MKRHLATISFGIALLACVVSPAAAQRYLYPPGPPYRSCPDTLTLFDVQQPDTTLAPCHPATLDTVWGVQGVITGFDARPSAYGFYIQTVNANTLAWSGVDVFTGATNYNSSVPGTPTGGNLVLGDVVRVYGTTQEFPATNGETEIEGPDLSQSTNDIIIRKVGTAPVPAPKVGTTADFNWVPGISAATAEPYEGCLVRINGPMHVARVQTGAGLFANNYLVVADATPADSVMVDAFTLFVAGAPPLNTPIDYVQGILNQRNGQGGVNSYRIQIRDANDISVAAPPNLVEAYPLENNKLRLLFDKNLDLTAAQNEANYSLGSGLGGSTVDLATLVGGAGTTVELDITSVLNPGDDETVTAQSIGTATCPTCLSSSQTLEFAHGITPLYEETAAGAQLGTAGILTTFKGIQAPDPAFLSPCDDRSKYAGPGTAFGRRVTVRGVGVQQYGSLHYLVGLAGGKRNGVSVFGPSQPLVPGRQYRIACRVQEFGGETELVNTVSITDEGPAAVPAASIQTVNDLADTTCDASQSNNTGEDYEGVLVRVMQARVVNFNTPPLDPAAGGSFRIVQPAAPPGADTILVSSLGGHYTYDPTAGDVINVTGICHQDGTFRILPRSDADITVTDIGVGIDPGSLDFALEVKPTMGSKHTVRFSLPRADQVELAVFDLLGRRMAVLASGHLEAGVYLREWDGRDADGQPAGSGMYFYRLRVGERVRTMRAVRVE